MNDPFFGRAVQFADGFTYSFFGIVSGGNGIASLCYLCANKRFDAAIVQAALPFLAHTLFSSGIIGHVSNKPPRNIWPFHTDGLYTKNAASPDAREGLASRPYHTVFMNWLESGV